MKKQVLNLCATLIMTACLGIPTVLVSANTINGDVLNGDSAGDYNDVVPTEMEQLMAALVKSSQSGDNINMMN